MTEAFLHYIWKYKLFYKKELITTEGESLIVIQSGTHNSNAGPDFFNAKIKIGKTTWAGNIEIHIKSSDWNKHQHSKDKAYQNVVLHVVYEADNTIKDTLGNVIPCLELKNCFDPGIYKNYQKLLRAKDWIPCGSKINQVSSIALNHWLERLMIERLERKTKDIFDRLKQNHNNWEETFYQFLSKSFGLKVNNEPFEMLSRSLPLKVLVRHKNKLIELEALLLGQAGFLEKDFKEEYPNELKTTYKHLQKKFKLKPLAVHQWKFLRLRPANFPTIRLAQLASLIHHSSSMFSKILSSGHYKDIIELFNVKPSAYWLTHYQLDKPSTKKEKNLGTKSIDSLMINTIAPFLFVYGELHGEPSIKNKALQLLQSIPKENNAILDNWSKLGIKVKNAFRSQALLELKNEYCNQKRCLDCAIGYKILQAD